MVDLNAISEAHAFTNIYGLVSAVELTQFGGILILFGPLHKMLKWYNENTKCEYMVLALFTETSKQRNDVTKFTIYFPDI